MHSLLQNIRELVASRQLIGVMTRREVAARHAGTALGVLWPYLQPLLSVAAYYLVFDIVFSMRLGDGAKTHAVGTFLIVGALNRVQSQPLRHALDSFLLRNLNATGRRIKPIRITNMAR